jgi:hypothetical protein
MPSPTFASDGHLLDTQICHNTNLEPGPVFGGQASGACTSRLARKRRDGPLDFNNVAEWTDQHGRPECG